jgi:ribonuclease HI
MKVVQKNKRKKKKNKKDVYSTGVWNMFFDNASSYFGAGARALLVAHDNQFVILFSYRLQWNVDHTNNVCEYVASVSGLEAARRMKIKNLEVFGDAELIVKHVNR